MFGCYSQYWLFNLKAVGCAYGQFKCFPLVWRCDLFSYLNGGLSRASHHEFECEDNAFEYSNQNLGWSENYENILKPRAWSSFFHFPIEMVGWYTRFSDKPKFFWFCMLCQSMLMSQFKVFKNYSSTVLYFRLHIVVKCYLILYTNKELDTFSAAIQKLTLEFWPEAICFLP